MLRYFDGRIAAELRLWDAIDQQYLAPFAYFGVHDGLDLRDVPWRRGQGYDVTALENVLTADHAWAHLVVEEVRRKVADPVTHARARLLRQRRPRALHGRAVHASSGCLPSRSRRRAVQTSGEPRSAISSDGKVRVVFTVDLFNEGIDVPNVDTLLLLRPTDSPTLFLQQLGRGLRKAAGKSVLHRPRFRRARTARSSASTGACARCSAARARTSSGRSEHGFPFLPAGCSFQLDPVAKEIVLAQHPRGDPEHVARAVRRAPLARRCRTRRRTSRAPASSSRTSTPAATAGRRCAARPACRPLRAGPAEAALLRAVGRLLHVDDDERLEAYPRLLRRRPPAILERLSPRERAPPPNARARRSRA